MHRAIIFNGIWVFAATVSVFFLRGRQVRRELDEQMNEEQQKTPSMRMDEANRFSSLEEPLMKA
jgi:hypothetical protein